jgi:hypothetical protein
MKTAFLSLENAALLTGRRRLRYCGIALGRPKLSLW